MNGQESAVTTGNFKFFRHIHSVNIWCPFNLKVGLS